MFFFSRSRSYFQPRSAHMRVWPSGQNFPLSSAKLRFPSARTSPSRTVPGGRGGGKGCRIIETV
jgi:hypothetical protein